MLIEMIEKELSLGSLYLNLLARSASHRYKEYFIPKASGGLRQILHPARELKTVQRWIHERILSEFPVHSAAGAYRRGHSLLKHVAHHQGAHFLLRMDFENFFPSLTDGDIRTHFQLHSKSLPSGWSDLDTQILVKFVCVEGRLTIGAVTSPSLSNTLCFDLDSKLFRYCAQRGITYTRYADDLFFSTNTPNQLSHVEKTVNETIRNLKYPTLRINARKTRHSSRKGRMAVTGLVLTPDGRVSLGRARKRKVRAQIHQWQGLSYNQKRYLSGYLAYCMAIEPDFVFSLSRKYGPELINEIRRFNSFEPTQEPALIDRHE